MSRSKRDILDTEKMLSNLASVLSDNCHAADQPYAEAVADAEALRRISMTLHRWHELECGNSNDHGSWAIVRGTRTSERIKTEQGLNVRKDTFVHDDDGDSYLEHHHYAHGRGQDSVSYTKIPDREAGARKRLAAIMARYPGLSAYVQTDPRGCALYILRPGDVLAGQNASCCYTRGLAVHR